MQAPVEPGRTSWTFRFHLISFMVLVRKQRTGDFQMDFVNTLTQKHLICCTSYLETKQEQLCDIQSCLTLLDHAQAWNNSSPANFDQEHFYQPATRPESQLWRWLSELFGSMRNRMDRPEIHNTCWHPPHLLARKKNFNLCIPIRCHGFFHSFLLFQQNKDIIDFCSFWCLLKLHTFFLFKTKR